MRRSFLLLVLLFAFAPSVRVEAGESAYDRVMRTGTLRCGYTVIPPELSRDPNTGEISGLVPDIVEEMGRRLDLKIEWTEDVSFPNMTVGLAAGRYDAVCFSLYRLASWAKSARFTRPLFYSRTNVYVRADDTRFDSGSLSSLDLPSVTIATVDGEMASFIARDQFPHAKTLSMPQTTDLSQMLLSVATHKADVAFVNGVVASGYLKANPGQLKAVYGDQPLRFFSHGLAVGSQEMTLLAMLNSALDEMDEQGFLGKVLSKHELWPHAYLRVARPYLAP